MSLSLLLVAAASLVLLSLKRIPEGQAYTVYRFGRYRRTLGSGLHWIVPLIERVAHRISLTGRALRVEPQALGPEGGPLRVKGTVWYQVLDPARADSEFDHLDEVVLGEVRNAMRRLADSESIHGKSLNAALKDETNEELRVHGVVVTRFKLSADPRTNH